MRTHYDNLQIPRDADEQTIRQAYRRLSKQYHPDLNPSEDASRIMQLINRAYTVLSDPNNAPNTTAGYNSRKPSASPNSPRCGGNPPRNPKGSLKTNTARPIPPPPHPKHPSKNCGSPSSSSPAAPLSPCFFGN